MKKIIITIITVLIILIVSAFFFLGNGQEKVGIEGEENALIDYEGFVLKDKVGQEIILRGSVLFDPEEVGVVTLTDGSYMISIIPLPGHVVKQGEDYTIKGVIVMEEDGYFIREKEYVKEEYVWWQFQVSRPE